jgi:hypothetical protein
VSPAAKSNFGGACLGRFMFECEHAVPQHGSSPDRAVKPKFGFRVLVILTQNGCIVGNEGTTENSGTLTAETSDSTLLSQHPKGTGCSPSFPSCRSHAVHSDKFCLAMKTQQAWLFAKRQPRVHPRCRSSRHRESRPDSVSVPRARSTARLAIKLCDSQSATGSLERPLKGPAKDQAKPACSSVHDSYFQIPSCSCQPPR